jgi:hypothetical protein
VQVLHWLEFTERLINMSKIFKRPMFRKGGPTSGMNGIMTGIVDRENHADDPFVGDLKNYIPTKEELAYVSSQLPERKEVKDEGMDPLSQFLISGGLSLLSATPRGGTLATAAEAFKQPTAGLFQDLASKRKEKKEEEREKYLTEADLFSDLIKTKGDIAAAKLGASDSAKMQTASAVRSLFAPKITAIEDKIIEAKQSGAGNDVLSPLVIELENLKTQSENAYLDVLVPGKSRSEQIIDMAAIIKENDLGGSKSNEQIIAEAESIIDMASGIKVKKADGGRIGYAMGTPEKVDAPMVNEPTMNAPAVESRARSIDMPFEEFRQKLPANITDDIANIIYYNSSAFADFANIETQDDVYSFNSKYDVNLTLPFNTETT